MRPINGGRSPTPNPAAAIIAQCVVDRLDETCGVLVVGVCGAQGSGKSTIAGELSRVLDEEGIFCAMLSLDDFYLGREARAELARRVHPLLATRGPPGTHDIASLLALTKDLRLGRPVTAPSFDKLSDDVVRGRGREIRGPIDVVILEGWCVGATPEAPSALAEPVNDLERLRDPESAWRTHVNDALAGDYRRLFEEIDMLVLLRAPDFAVVRRWRLQQEAANGAARGGGEAATLAMDDEAVGDFIQYYERLTRRILAEMPRRADLVIQLDEKRAVTGVFGPALAPTSNSNGLRSGAFLDYRRL